MPQLMDVFPASLCPVLPPEPDDQTASGVPFDGIIRLVWPGATYPGECVGYWGLTTTTPPSCDDVAMNMNVFTGHTDRISDGVYQASLIITMTAATGTSHFFNLTFAQEIVFDDTETYLFNGTVKK